MAENSIKFGTGGWRAIIGEDFTRENVYKVAQGFVNYMKAKKLADKPVIVGRDRRFLSDTAMNWFAEVLTGNQIKTILLTRSVPTPFTMWYVKKYELNFGVEITASHNPYNYNGIKIIVGEGRDAAVEVTDELEAYIAEVKSIDEVKAAHLPNEYLEITKKSMNGYIDEILSKMDVESVRNAGLRILFDPMHGSGAYPMMCIMYTSRCTVDLINDKRDAYFGHDLPSPTEHTLRDLMRNVVHENYDLGIAFDGDGDRLGIIDRDGRYLDANKILVMLYYYLHEYKGWKGPVVRNLSTTHMLDRVAEDLGEKCYEVPIGFKYISAKIDEVDAVLGGESSGGLTVRGHIHGKDSVYAASLFVEMCSAIGKTPSAFYQELEDKYGVHHLVESNLKFTPEDKSRIVKTLMEEKKLPVFSAEVDCAKYEDGCKVYFKNGDFVSCRFSGTEPLLRIFAESDTVEKGREYIDCFKTMLGI